MKCKHLDEIKLLLLGSGVSLYLPLPGCPEAHGIPRGHIKCIWFLNT